MIKNGKLKEEIKEEFFNYFKSIFESMPENEKSTTIHFKQKYLINEELFFNNRFKNPNHVSDASRILEREGLIEKKKAGRSSHKTVWDVKNLFDYFKYDYVEGTKEKQEETKPMITVKQEGKKGSYSEVIKALESLQKTIHDFPQEASEFLEGFNDVVKENNPNHVHALELQVETLKKEKESLKKQKQEIQKQQELKVNVNEDQIIRYRNQLIDEVDRVLHANPFYLKHNKEAFKKNIEEKLNLLLKESGVEKK